MMIYEPGSDENTHGSLETALKDNGFIAFTEGYTLGKAVLYIREYLREKEKPQKQPASH